MKTSNGGGSYSPRHKHGVVTHDAKGHKIETPFGKDDSDVGGGERYPERMKGGTRDLGHSIIGGKAPDPRT